MKSYLGGIYKAALAVAIAALMIGCRKEDFTLNFSHERHVVENEIECSVCHQTTNGDMSMPGHDVCSGCHEIDEANPSEACLQCHKARTPAEIEAAYAERAEAQHNDIAFSHKTHTYMDAKCEACHLRIEDAASAPESDLPPLEACLPCHDGEAAPLEDCSLCHEPGSPINATHRLDWEMQHGIASKFGNAQCMTCHHQSFCIDCHHDKEPKDHNNTFRRVTHGAEAAWNRTRCMACHQEDFCERCHEEAEPRSHKGGWAGGPTRHCFQCHFPMGSATCSVCHKAAPHPTAPASPHPPFTGFDCGECHPGGVPGRAPHPNPGHECLICHPRR